MNGIAGFCHVIAGGFHTGGCIGSGNKEFTNLMFRYKRGKSCVLSA